jgi:NAD(P)H-quinone oxidoreductase subunit 5
VTPLFSYAILEILTLGNLFTGWYLYNQSLVVTGARDAFLTKRAGDSILVGAVGLRSVDRTSELHRSSRMGKTTDVNWTTITP